MKPTTIPTLAILLAACGTERPMTDPSLQEHPEAASASTGYRAIDLGTLGGPTASATAINPAGQVVGYSTNRAGKTRAFLWTKGTMRGLGHLGGGHSWAYGINKSGQVVGKSLTASGEEHAFIWTNGVMKDLGTLGGSSSLAIGVDSLGRAVGSSDTDKEWPWESRAVLWRKNGTIVDLVGAASHASGIDPSGNMIVGTRISGHPFLWTPEGVTDIVIPGGGGVTDMGPAGHVAGWGWKDGRGGESVEYALVWKDGVVTPLGTLGGEWSQATAANALGHVVGYSATATGQGHAFVWKAGVMTDLGTLGGGSSGANDINRAGRVVGQANDGAGRHRATLWKPE